MDDLTDEDSFELILSKFQNWNTDDETKLINAIGLDVFIDEIGLNPYKYADFNVAIQHAITLAGSFLEEVTIASGIPAEKVRNAQGLVDEFSAIRMLSNLPNFWQNMGQFQSIQPSCSR